MDFLVRGIERFQHGDLAAALNDFDEAVRIDATRAEARANRGVVKHSLGDLAGALADFDGALGVNPGHAETYCNRAEVRRALGDVAGASADLDTALAIRRKSAFVLCSRGFHRLRERDFPGALAEFNAAIEFNLRYCWAHMGRGNTRYHMGDVTAANLDLRSAFAIDPDFYAKTRSKTTLADSLDSDQAFADCENHLNRNPDDFLAHARRGFLLLMLGRDDEARRDFDQFLILSPADRARLERTAHEVKRRRLTR